MGTIRPQIVLFGDSIVEFSLQVDQNGWGASLASHFSRKADVLVRGFAGYNTRLGLTLLDKIFPIPSSNPPALVIISFGGNDAADPNAGHKRVHVPLPEFNENLKKIVAHVKKASALTKIILIGVHPVSEDMIVKSKWVKTWWPDTLGLPTRRNDLNKLYAAECVQVALETNVQVINLWSMYMKAQDWDTKYINNVTCHLSAEGNRKLFQELLKMLELYPSLNARKMSANFPAITRLGEDPVADLKAWHIRSRI